MLAKLIVVVVLNFADGKIHEGGILFPQDSEVRQVKSLDGLWNFVVANYSHPYLGIRNEWFARSLTSLEEQQVQLMPVPSSYNDVTTEWDIREHVGLVWYDRYFFVPKKWQDESRIWLRFGSISYAAQVWINGKLVMSHEIGKLPFVAEITDYLKFGAENLVTVACDNTLLEDTIPQGTIHELSSGRIAQSYSFDFFNYAGIDRPVKLYTTPQTYIDDITVNPLVGNSVAELDYSISVIGNDIVKTNVFLLDRDNNLIDFANGSLDGVLKIPKPYLWWPYLMHPDPGYLYKLKVELRDAEDNLIDVYRLPVGLRTISWSETQLLINDQPIYLHGFGRHEDSDIRGKGLDLPLIIRDYNLIKWIGANAYRTSHYPYAEEIMDLADSMGIMIIDECPSVNTEMFSDSLLTRHKQSLSELIQRDKNRPSVVMWSAANEPRTGDLRAGAYFKKIIEHIKSKDLSRPTTIVEAQNPIVNSSKYVDVINFNYYSGWYVNAGNIDLITDSVIQRATDFHNNYKKPVIMQEYGADTLEGLHFVPNFIWSEEYQTELMSQHFKAFDRLRDAGFFIGEFIWNFADFKTAQSYTRVGGNKKGIFTRNRQPKSSAFHLRRRYWALAKQLYNVSLPNDLNEYVIKRETCSIDNKDDYC